MSCAHKNFSAEVVVNRLEDVGGFMADMRIRCADCELPFIFPEIKAGLSPTEPRVSEDGQELRVPIAPKDSRIFPAIPGFDVRAM